MRSVLAGLIGIAATTCSSLAEPTESYVLNCSGTLTQTAVSGATQSQIPPQNYTTHVSVDLEHRTFCQDECKSQELISKVLPDDVVFRSNASPQLERFWVTDDGQFSNTWLEVHTEGSDKSYVLMSARGFCEKSPNLRLTASEPVPAKPLALHEAPAQQVPKPLVQRDASAQPVAKALVEHDTSTQQVEPSRPLSMLGFTEISALVDIKNHRPVSAKLHTELQSLGYIRMQDDLWILTAKAEALVSGDPK